jgi:MFS family permease
MSTEAKVTAAGEKTSPTLWSPLSSRNYSYLWAGETISVLGTQFNLVALPWLVLKLTGSGFTLGAVMMTAGIPRALLMLVGGIISDRLSPRSTLLLSNLARAVIVSCMAALVWTDSMRMEWLLLLVFLFGMADAFFYPAYMAIVPSVVEAEKIAPANSLMQSSAQLMVLVGPALAGVVIATSGVAQAFGVDSLSFIVAAVMLSLVHVERSSAHSAGAPRAGILDSMREGLRYTWDDGFIRGIVLITAVTNLAFTGPFAVGTALIANDKFHSAASLGIMLSASGAGALLGALAAGVWRPARRRGVFILMFPVTIAVGLVGMAMAPNLATAAAVRAAINFTTGFMNVFITTLLQQRIAPNVRGRVMSVVMLSMFGLLPFSFLLAGTVSQFGAAFLFFAAAGFVFAGALLASMISGLRRFQ